MINADSGELQIHQLDHKNSLIDRRASIYTFSFSIATHPYILDYFDIWLRVNGCRIGQSFASSGIFGAPVTMQSTLRLKVGIDRIDLGKFTNAPTIVITLAAL